MNRLRVKKWMSGLLAVPVLLSSCSSDGPEIDDKTPNERTRIELTAQTRAAATGLLDFYARFTTDMTDYIDGQAGEKNKNVVVSPLSAAIVFAMTANGVDEKSQKEYTEYLGVNDIESLNDLCRVLLDRLPEADNTSLFNLANSVWVNSGMGMTLNKDYSERVSSKYDAEIRYQDFRDEAGTLEALNNWCASNTGNRITSHFKEVNSGNLAILINALYFKGKWHNEIFDASRTKPETFHGLNGDSEVMMMESDFYEGTYANDGEFEYLTLNFGNESYRLEIVLPASSDASRRSATGIDYKKIADLRRASYGTSVKAYIPKFKVEGQQNLNGMLEAIGKSPLLSFDMTMFTTPTGGSIRYMQSTFFSVDETGTEVAAVTSGEIDGAAFPTEVEQAIVHVDRPFYFFISEFSTGACILSGRIADL